MVIIDPRKTSEPMSTEPLTPGPTTTPAPQYSPTGKSSLSKHGRSFWKQQANDHKYYKSNVNKMIRMDSQWATYSPQEREVKIRERRLKLIKQRNGCDMSTAGKDFPDLHNENAEVAWLLEAFNSAIEIAMPQSEAVRGMGRAKGYVRYEESSDDDVDGDDEEELPTSRVKKEIKREHDEDEESDDDDADSEATLCGKDAASKAMSQVTKANEPVVIFSLALRIKSGQVKPTKPYWSCNEKMEMVLIMPAWGSPVVSKEGNLC
jgi:hypothetical protein